MLDLARVRQEYMRDGLDEKDVLADPLAQFARWFDDAQKADLIMPNAMSLATVSADGKPSSRVVLLKGVDEGLGGLGGLSGHSGGFVFYTDYDSRKGREIAGNNHASLLFAWLPLERQVRIDGTLDAPEAVGSPRVVEVDVLRLQAGVDQEQHGAQVFPALEVGGRGRVVVAVVHADEDGAPAARVLEDGLEDRLLATARSAPRRPEVHDDDAALEARRVERPAPDERRAQVRERTGDGDGVALGAHARAGRDEEDDAEQRGAGDPAAHLR